MIRPVVYFIFISLLSVSLAQAQYFKFSSDQEQFVNDVVANLTALNTESMHKVAYDFRAVWTAQFDETQRISVISLCEKMKKRRMRTQPYYKYFFSFLTYSLTQKGATSSELTTLLDISHHVVDHYGNREVSDFFQTLTLYFARGTLYSSNYNKLTTKGGTYALELLEEAAPVAPSDEEEEYVDDEEEFISEDEIEEYSAPNGGTWGSDDNWGSEETQTEEEQVTEEENEESKALKRNQSTFVKVDYIANLKVNDIDPILEGPVIHIEEADFKISTPYDTLTITHASGTFIIKDQIFVGTAGQLDWPNDLRGTDGAVVTLQGFSFNVSKPILQTTRAKLEFPSMYLGAIEGEFKYKSGKRLPSDSKKYPQFTSFYANTILNLPSNQAKYVGGFALKGSKKFGMSISKDLATLTVSDGKGRSFVTESEKYIFEDSSILSDKASFVLYHGSDSIYHPVVRLTYNPTAPKVSILHDKGDYKNTYFYSSYFKLEFKADIIEWTLGTDSLDISILNAKNRLPALFESEEYFNPIRYKKMVGLFRVHPLMSVVRFARLIQTPSFNITEIIHHFHLEPKLANAIMSYLRQNGYILYNKETGNVKVLRKGFHYVMSNTKKKDFDNILISSIAPNEPNASLNFKTGKMKVNGVRKVFITPDHDVHITPKGNHLTLLKDKNMMFDGSIHAGNFRYIGNDFVFNYNEYLMQMEKIDSIQIQVHIKEDSLGEKRGITNHLEHTSGTLYINHPKNKAGVRKYNQYPYFVSDSEAIVYFDSPEVLDGAYDKSMYFVLPPFEMDSLDRKDDKGIAFEGTFYAGGIIAPIQEKLHILPDHSLGFKHKIPTNGYALYGGEGRVYDSLSLSSKGLKANGRIDYRTTTVHSKDFVFYMDSVTAIGHDGVIRAGQIEAASYPEAVLTDYKMLWLPTKDSMYIENRKEPFQFYNATASLTGKANITASGVFGSGTMLSHESKSISKQFHFSEYEYSGRHARFEILTDNPNKPAMEGDDISMVFDLNHNIAHVSPEVQGVAAISFPYAQIKTSITEAVWYLDSAKISMSKPETMDIKSSYFYTTRLDLDSLVFSATNAIYDINSYELNIKGIPYIKVADAEIIPDNNETTILENSVLQPFKNAKLKLDTLNGYHHLYDGDITIFSRKKFNGSATYELINAAQDTSSIAFASFEMQSIPMGKDQMDSMTVAHGIVSKGDVFIASAGFQFAGNATMYAKKRSLEFKGKVRPIIRSLGIHDYWINHKTSSDSQEIKINLATATTTEDQPVEAGIYYDNIHNDLYMGLAQQKKREGDFYLFKAEGLFFYRPTTQDFIVEAPSKTSNDTYGGKSFIYNDLNEDLIFEGPIDFIKSNQHFKLNATVLGKAKPDANTYTMDVMFGLEMDIHASLVSMLALHLEDVVAQMGPDVAHSNDIKMLYKLASIIGDPAVKHYENTSLKKYIPLYSSSPKIENTLFISNVSMNWSSQHHAFYNTSKIGLSHVKLTDLNALADGFIEIKKSQEDFTDIMRIFIQLSPAAWYYFSYEHSNLLMFSSNADFNNNVATYSNTKKTGFDTYTTMLGDEFEVLKFINQFRHEYYGITDSYNLALPTTTHLEEEMLETTPEEVDATPIEDGEEEELTEEEDGF